MTNTGKASKKKAATARPRKPAATLRSTPAPAAPLIYSSIMLVMAAIEPIIRRHTHGSGEFDFAKMDQITSALRPLMITNRIFPTPHAVLEHIETVRQKGSGDYGIWIFTKLKIEWRIYAIDGSFVPATTMGEGMSDQHFSTAAAQTMSFKSMLEKVFVLPLLANGNTEPESIDAGSDFIEPPETGFTGTMPDLSSPSSAALPVSISGRLKSEHTADDPISKGMLNIIRSNLANHTAVTAADVCKRFGVETNDGEKPDAALARIKKSQMQEVVAYIASDGK